MFLILVDRPNSGVYKASGQQKEDAGEIKDDKGASPLKWLISDYFVWQQAGMTWQLHIMARLFKARLMLILG